LLDVVNVPGVYDRLIRLVEVEPVEVAGFTIILKYRSLLGVRSRPFDNDWLANGDRFFGYQYRWHWALLTPELPHVT